MPSSISIIIPACNEGANLGVLLPYLNSIGNEGVELETIVALSAKNSDDSPAICQGARIRCLQCMGSGRAVQMNSAAAEASGDILVFLHADVLPPKDFIRDIMQTIAKGFDAGFFSYRFDSDKWLLKINSYFTSRDGIFTGGGDQCLFISRKCFKQLGGFDSQQLLMEDFEIFRRIKKNKLRYRIIKNDLLVSARKYDNNSYLRVNLSNFLLVVLFRLGYHPRNLRKLHNQLIRVAPSRK